MKVSENKIITFRNSILTGDKKELNRYHAKVLFSPACLGSKLISKLQDSEIGNIIEIYYSKEELGKYDPDNVVSIPKDQLSTDLVPVKGMLVKTIQNNMPFTGHISSIEDKTVTIDLNHPLLFLNTDVIFQIEILNIEDSDHVESIEPYDQFLSLHLNQDRSIIIHEDPFN